jgi:hypothetical protein
MVAGVSYAPDGGAGSRTFVWSPGAGMADIGSLGGRYATARLR